MAFDYVKARGLVVQWENILYSVICIHKIPPPNKYAYVAIFYYSRFNHLQSCIYICIFVNLIKLITKTMPI